MSIEKKLFGKTRSASISGREIKRWVEARNDIYVPHAKEIFKISKDNEIPLGKIEGLNDPYFEKKFNDFRDQTRRRFNKSQLNNKPQFKIS